MSEDDAASFAHCSRCGYGPCKCSSTKTRSRHDRHGPVKETEETIRIELFEAKKKDKKNEEATRVYQDVMAFDKSRQTSDEVLKLMVSFADMQICQGNCGEAETTVNNVLRWKNLPHGLEKQCHAIRGKVLCARKRYNEAETLYRKLYDRSSKDEWSLDMGDEMCGVIALQGDYDLARLEQTNLLEKRKKSLGASHPSTVKTATMAVENIRKLIQKLPRDDGRTRDRSNKRKQALVAEIEYLLYDIWMSIAGTTQKDGANVLKIGHELGSSFSSQEKWEQAEMVLAQVWQGRKEKLGDFNKDTLSSGISLGEAMYRQEMPLAEAAYQSPKCQTARSIFEHIGTSGLARTYGVDESVAAAARAHLGVVFAILKAYDMAEQLLRSFGWSSNNASAGTVVMPPADLVQYALTKCLEGQGGGNRVGAQGLQLDSSRCGGMYPSMTQDPYMRNRLLTGPQSPWAGTNLPLTGTTPGRLAIAPDAFNNQNGTSTMGGRGLDFYRTALLNGNRCLDSRDFERAKTVLGQAWNQDTYDPQEAVMRARCGDQYGNALTRLRHYEKARRVLQDVKALKKSLYPGLPNQERRNTGTLRRAIPDTGRYGSRVYGRSSKRNETPSIWRMMVT